MCRKKPGGIWLPDSLVLLFPCPVRHNDSLTRQRNAMEHSCLHLSSCRTMALRYMILGIYEDSSTNDIRKFSAFYRGYLPAGTPKNPSEASRNESRCARGH